MEAIKAVVNSTVPSPTSVIFAKPNDSQTSSDAAGLLRRPSSFLAMLMFVMFIVFSAPPNISTEYLPNLCKCVSAAGPNIASTRKRSKRKHDPDFAYPGGKRVKIDLAFIRDILADVLKDGLTSREEAVNIELRRERAHEAYRHGRETLEGESSQVIKSRSSLTYEFTFGAPRARHFVTSEAYSISDTLPNVRSDEMEGLRASKYASSPYVEPESAGLCERASIQNFARHKVPEKQEESLVNGLRPATQTPRAGTRTAAMFTFGRYMQLETFSPEQDTSPETTEREDANSPTATCGIDRIDSKLNNFVAQKPSNLDPQSKACYYQTPTSRRSFSNRSSSIGSAATTLIIRKAPQVIKQNGRQALTCSITTIANLPLDRVAYPPPIHIIESCVSHWARMRPKELRPRDPDYHEFLGTRELTVRLGHRLRAEKLETSKLLAASLARRLEQASSSAKHQRPKSLPGMTSKHALTSTIGLAPAPTPTHYSAPAAHSPWHEIHAPTYTNLSETSSFSSASNDSSHDDPTIWFRIDHRTSVTTMLTLALGQPAPASAPRSPLPEYPKLFAAPPGYSVALDAVATVEHGAANVARDQAGALDMLEGRVAGISGTNGGFEAQDGDEVWWGCDSGGARRRRGVRWIGLGTGIRRTYSEREKQREKQQEKLREKLREKGRRLQAEAAEMERRDREWEWERERLKAERALKEMRAMIDGEGRLSASQGIVYDAEDDAEADEEADEDDDNDEDGDDAGDSDEERVPSVSEEYSWSEARRQERWNMFSWWFETSLD